MFEAADEMDSHGIKEPMIFLSEVNVSQTRIHAYTLNVNMRSFRVYTLSFS